MRILYLRSTYGTIESRVEKELFSLGKEHAVEFLGWNRDESFPGISETKVDISGKEFLCRHMGIKAAYGAGIKKMFFPMLRFWFRMYLYLRRNLKNYDAVHACDLDAALPLLLLPKRIPIVYDIFDYYVEAHGVPGLMRTALRRIEGRIIRKSDVVILCSEARRQQILPEVPPNLVVIHNTPTAEFLPDAGASEPNRQGPCKIGYVGVLVRDGRYLKEMAEVVASRRDVELHIGGFGALESYMAEQAKAHDNIHFYGRMSYQEALALEMRSDILTAIYDPNVPNHKYAAPNKFYEALMLKKPLIMMRNTGMDSYVEENDLGEVLDCGAEGFKEGFSAALDRLIQRRDEWAEMGERGYRLYEEQFSWAEMERRLLRIYEDLGGREERQGADCK